MRRGVGFEKRPPVERSQRPGCYRRAPRADSPDPTSRVFESRIEFQSNPGTIRRTYLLARGAAVEEERARAGQEFTIDLRLYTEVLWRHRLLVGVGLAVALALAFLSVCARLLGRARVPQAGDLVQRIGPRPFTGELSRGSFCAPAEHGPQPVRYNRRSVRSACDERRGHRLSQEAGPARARRGGNCGAPDRRGRGAVCRDRRSDASARADGGWRNAGRSDEAGDPGDGHVHQFRQVASAGRRDPEGSAGSA